MEIWATMRQEPDGSWSASTREDPPRLATGRTREACLERLRKAAFTARPAGSARPTLVVEVLPVLAGVAEAAEVMGWDKRRVITYISRDRFPHALQGLASGRIWVRSDLEEFATRWRVRQRERERKRRRRTDRGRSR